MSVQNAEESQAAVKTGQRLGSRSRAGVLVAAAVVAAVVPLVVVTACGPFFDEPVFVPSSRPQSQQDFARGRLGVLQPGYWLRDKVVAYRYLSGSTLSKPEQEAYLAPPQGEGYVAEDDATRPVNQWRTERAAALHLDLKTADEQAAPKIVQERQVEVKRNGYSEFNTFLNCPDDAFVAATASLHSRSKQWGAGSAELAGWIKGQDAVFSNCAKPGATPEAVKAGANSLLRYDREYQVAAANFYAGNYDAAIAGFEAVGRNASSPWQPWGEYLAARAEVRKAAMAVPFGGWGDQAKFDNALLQKAHDRLTSLAKVADPRIAAAAEGEIGFINVRLAPQRRLEEVATALSGPKPDDEFEQDLADLIFLTSHNTTGNTDLLRWIGASGKPDAEAKQGSEARLNPVTQWRSTHSTPWLVAALAEMKGSDSAAAELEAAAAKIPADAPGYVTVSYQRARLMLEKKSYAAARTLTTTVIGSLKGDDMSGAKNALLGERMQTAFSYDEFLADAPRTVVETDNSVEAPQPVVPGKATVNFDWDAVTAFNRQLPLARWVEAAQSKQLPDNLRRVVALAAWLRAVGLDDAATAKTTTALLPASLRSAPDEFAVTLFLLRHPGLRPYLEQGQQRSVDATGLDSFRDNWWCQSWGNGPTQINPDGGQPATQLLPVGFLSAAERSAAEDEAKRLNALPSGVQWLGRRTIDYAKAHPDDKQVPEALALTVRATRYGCYTGGDDDKGTLAQKAVSKEAFNLLHKQYPKSPWTAKTPYYY